MTLHVIALLLLVTGCDALFRLNEIAPASDSSVSIDAPDACPLVESFAGNVADVLASWTVTMGTSCSVDVLAGELVLATPASVACYAGLSSRRRFSFTNGGTLTVRVPKTVIAGASETYVVLSSDSNDFFYMQSTGGRFRTFTRVDDTDFDELDIEYDSVQHAYWRIEVRPDASGATVGYATSSDLTTWVQQNAATARIAVSSMEVELGAGSYDTSGPAHSSHFDDITVCAQ